jgi:hypothetical protein
MMALYEKNRLLVFILLNLVGISVFLYFFINSNKKAWYKHYWKGFFFISLGLMQSLFGMIVPLPKLWQSMSNIIFLTLDLYGFYLIISGWKLAKNELEKNM